MAVGLFSNLLSTNTHFLIIVLTVHDIVDFLLDSFAWFIGVSRYTCSI